MGPENGPFSPTCSMYTLKNTDNTSLMWTATVVNDWLDISSGSGTLAGVEITKVNVCISPTAESLAPGVRTDEITFTELTKGLSHIVPVKLTILTCASVPFFEDFEGGSGLPVYWNVTGTNDYRTEVTSLNEPHTGTEHLVMDDSISDTVASRNELTLCIDLTGYQDVQLFFWMKEFNDEDDVLPSSPFTDGADFDGVAISENEALWYSSTELDGK